MAGKRDKEQNFMWLIVLEAALALAVLVFVVWWTMFSGRPQGELLPDENAKPEAPTPPDQVERGGSKKLKG